MSSSIEAAPTARSRTSDCDGRGHGIEYDALMTARSSRRTMFATHAPQPNHSQLHNASEVKALKSLRGPLRSARG